MLSCFCSIPTALGEVCPSGDAGWLSGLNRQLLHAVRIATCRTPWARSTAAHVLAVAPEVSTSSTNTTVLPRGTARWRTANAPSTLLAREVTVGSPWGVVERVRIRARVATGRLSFVPMRSANQAAWSNPRWRRRDECKGTGTNTGRFRAARWQRNRAAIARARNLPAATSASSLKRRTRAPPLPANQKGALCRARLASSW